MSIAARILSAPISVDAMLERAYAVMGRPREYYGGGDTVIFRFSDHSRAQFVYEHPLGAWTVAGWAEPGDVDMGRTYAEVQP